VEDFAAYRDERLETVKPSSVRREFDILRSVFEIARREWGYPLPNIVTEIKVSGASTHRERRLREGEFERLMKAARECRSDTIGRIIVFALETGMRRGEILAVEWGHIDWSEPSLLIPKTKNGHARIIPLTNKALTILERIRKAGVEKPFPITANALRMSWDRLRRRAGLTDLNFHDLRHERISSLFELGLSVPEVALVSGHRDLAMLNRYTHPQRKIIWNKINNPI